MGRGTETDRDGTSGVGGVFLLEAAGSWVADMLGEVTKRLNRRKKTEMKGCQKENGRMAQDEE